MLLHNYCVSDHCCVYDMKNEKLLGGQKKENVYPTFSNILLKISAIE